MLRPSSQSAGVTASSTTSRVAYLEPLKAGLEFPFTTLEKLLLARQSAASSAATAATVGPQFGGRVSSVIAAFGRTALGAEAAVNAGSSIDFDSLDAGAAVVGLLAWARVEVGGMVADGIKGGDGFDPA